jgi:hypothetical protein
MGAAVPLAVLVLLLRRVGVRGMATNEVKRVEERRESLRLRVCVCVWCALLRHRL